MSGGGIGLLSEISYASERRPDLVGGCDMSTGDLVVGDADGELNHRHTDCHDLKRTWVTVERVMHLADRAAIWSVPFTQYWAHPTETHKATRSIDDGSAILD